MKTKTAFRAIFCLAVVATASALGQQPPPALPQDASQYVRQVIQHELDVDGHDQSLWRYRFHRESDRIIYDRDVVETREGQIARTLLISNQPLSPQQRADDDARLQSLMHDADDRAKHNKRIKDDRDRARRMLQALPDAFDFKYDGTEDGLVRLQFSPRPRYDAPTRELQAYRSMTGTLWIDSAGAHVARIDGKLFEDVNFGWGLLGRLKKGGTFHVVQKEVAPGHWEIVALDVDMTGYAVIFKSINVKQHQRQMDFHRMPDDMTLSRAYELLQKDPLPATTAENKR